MQAQEIIQKKRDGEENSSLELQFLMKGFLSGEIKDYQLSAWMMAVYFTGLSDRELSEWMRLMLKSGKTFPKTNTSQRWIDKHSVGGVGDKPSLILVPLVTATCEKLFGRGKVKIPMVSGRGLGHSGGTLDKLESVPGFSPRLPISEAIQKLETNGFFMVGQTEEIVPADKALYALRDVTATVDSIPLIVSSILSKKLAENLNALVIDIKMGRGAFMPERERALELGRKLVSVAKREGVDTIALLTNMDQPLGYAVGNRLEVEECWDFLCGVRQEPGLREIVIALGTWMVFLGGERRVPMKKCEEGILSHLSHVRSQELFIQMFTAQGGDWEAFQKMGLSPDHLVTDCVAPETGVISQIDAKAIGLMLNELGGGRKSMEKHIDSRVGFEFKKKVGDSVKKGETMMKIYHRRDYPIDLLKCEVIQIGTTAPASWWVGETIS